MKSTNIYAKLGLLVLTGSIITLSACGNQVEEAHSEAINSGLDALISENYDKAEVYFELALEEKPNDTSAKSYLEQTQLYNEAIKAFDTNDFEIAKLKAEGVTNITEGTESLVTKANDMLDRIKKRETSTAYLQKKYDEIINLIDAGRLDEAQEKTESLLSDNEINEAYLSDIKVNAEKAREDIEVEKNEIQKNEEAEKTEEVEEVVPSDTIEAYNELPLPLKVLLATTTVDERAMSPELMGYTLNYNFDEENLLVNVHSGAGSGHPWFILQFDTETITPVNGVVAMGIDGYEEVLVDTTPISKIDLYNRYMGSKESYDLALENVSEYPEMTMTQYEELQSFIVQ